MPANGLDAGDDTGFVFAFLKGGFHLPAHGAPFSRPDFLMDAAIRDDLDAAIRQQQVNQNASVVLGIP
ncbi:hypothetical protein PCE31106_03157 [Pandoraea cepalis]|uniref:Uncharacterized protein n=1 Tax=Pandoraea cepalis TaxID=2508294 RepID=A0A5E4WEQ7_9BURK|nr:hypothetical protein PCE31106_03157 [Pandoraea cepalis]